MWQGGVVTDDLTLRRLGADEGRKLLLLGDVRTIKAGASDTGGELTVLEQVVAPGAASALHRHAYQEVFYLLEGELEFTGLDNGERVTFAVVAGGTVHAAPGAPHGYRNTGTAPARFLAIIQPSGADGFFEEVGVWLDEGRAPAEQAEPSPERIRAAAARHGIEFLPGP
jgi:quercetin dioxygenase-like cupin family protein